MITPTELIQSKRTQAAELRAQDYPRRADELIEEAEVIELLQEAYKAATLFIKCHVADWDITEEMRLAYRYWQECDAALQLPEQMEGK